jgi:hypothetical protein
VCYLLENNACSPLHVNRRYGEICRLHLEGRIRRTWYQRESTLQVIFNAQQGVISQNVEFFP